MPPARTARPRAVNNENDENVVSRVTRAKATALNTDDTVGAVKKALQQTKKTSTALTAANAQRKRTALGDVSNVKRTEQEDNTKDSKKATKPALVAKTTNGVTKPGKAATNAKPLGLKEKKTSSTNLKRPASGSGVGGSAKKRTTGSGVIRTTIKEEEEFSTENEPPRSNPAAVNMKQGATTETAQKEPVVEDLKEDEEFVDLDLEDADDPLMVSEYAVEIFEYLRELELTNMPNASYMDFQDHLTWKKRDMLNDWLIEVHQKFQLLPETFYLAINIIDRFLSRKIVQLDKLQLVGITAMFIASKYEEVMSPHVSNFSYLAQEYSDEEILSAERFILETLSYDLSYPNPMNFLRRISKADSYDMQTRTIGKYLLEISCLDHRFLQYPPSQVSAAAMYFARMMLDRGEWDRVIAHYSGYTEDELSPVFHLMIDYVTASRPKHEAFHTKYASRKYLKASLLVKGWAKRHFPESFSQRQNGDNVLGAADIKSRKPEH